MASLVDIARAMDKEKASKEQKATVTVPSELAPKSTTLSLVDIAKAQQQPAATSAATKPLTLIDVARKADATKDTAVSAVSLQSLAREINDEERNRLDSAITKIATDVKHEKAQARADALKAATDEVLRDEQAKSQKRQQSNVRAASSDASDHAPKAKASPPPTTKPPANEGVNEDGYSSFEDDAVEPEKTKQAPPVATKPKQKRPVKEKEPADNQSDSGSAAGHERTVPSASPLAKEFLRAIYRGDTRRVRDMMRDEEDLDANTADQHGWSALHWAASQGQSEILSILLEKDARVDAVEHVNGWTALHLAVLRDGVACAKKLLHAGAATTVHDLYGDSAYDLLRAVKGKKKERWLLLLDAARHK